MSLRSTSRSLLATAVAASLLASAPALARTADEGGAAVQTSSLAGTVSPHQDLRGEHAQDAARAITHAPPKPLQDLRGEHARDAARAIPIPLAPLQDLRGELARDAARPAPVPVTPAAGTQAQPAKSLPATDDGRNRTWLIVLVGLAGAAIAAGGTAGVRSHRHA